MKPWKVQKFFGDIVYDLRSRRLLPVVILLVVAMIAVPMVISQGGSGTSSGSLQPTAGAAQGAPENEHAVVSYTPPGLRDYKKRLNDLSPKDPFRQQFAQSAATASALTSTVTPTQTGAATTTSSGTSTAVGTPVGSTGSGNKKKKKHKKQSSSGPVTYQTDVLAGDVNTTLTPFNNVSAMTPLPSQTTPVVIYFGLSSDFTHALFLVSNKVATATGPGSCVPAPDDCALLSLAAGQSEDLGYTQDGKTYRIVVAEIKRFTK